MQENLAKLNEGELLQNVPNPFNGTTQIGYKLENESTVHLNIYNYTGQLISQINEGTQTKGTHQISFNATGLTNGIYFYSISVNGQTTDARKMTVIK
jgi:flagellar hook assembly protein FlgD